MTRRGRQCSRCQAEAGGTVDCQKSQAAGSSPVTNSKSYLSNYHVTGVSLSSHDRKQYSNRAVLRAAACRG